MDRLFKCYYCGHVTKAMNELQCPECMTLDALYEARELIYDEEEGVYDFGEDESAADIW